MVGPRLRRPYRRSTTLSIRLAARRRRVRARSWHITRRRFSMRRSASCRNATAPSPAIAASGTTGITTSTRLWIAISPSRCCDTFDRASSPTISKRNWTAGAAALRDYLQLRSVPVDMDVTVAGVDVPMIVRPHGREVWIDFHHALVDPDLAPSSVALQARTQFTEFVAVDVFTLAHDLPSAVARLGLKASVSS